MILTEKKSEVAYGAKPTTNIIEVIMMARPEK
jgi:hypothetical protein